MSRLALALALLVAGGVIGLRSPALSGGTLLGVLVIIAGAEWLIRLTLPLVDAGTLEDAADLIAAEQHK